MKIVAIILLAILPSCLRKLPNKLKQLDPQAGIDVLSSAGFHDIKIGAISYEQKGKEIFGISVNKLVKVSPEGCPGNSVSFAPFIAKNKNNALIGGSLCNIDIGGIVIVFSK